MEKICRDIVESHDDILIAALLEKEDAVDFYVRPGTPVPDDFRTGNMILQTQLVVSTIRQNEDYLGRLSFNHVHMGKADVLHFPLGNARILVVVVKPQQVRDSPVNKVLEVLQRT